LKGVHIYKREGGWEGGRDGVISWSIAPNQSPLTATILIIIRGVSIVVGSSMAINGGAKRVVVMRETALIVMWCGERGNCGERAIILVRVFIVKDAILMGWVIYIICVYGIHVCNIYISIYIFIYNESVYVYIRGNL
jgi:hypothetical protein